MTKPNTRVGAVSHTDEEGKIYLFGYGVYEGDEVPPKGIRFMGIELGEEGIENPKIKLDNDKIVWGCECWWGSEDAVRQRAEKYKEIVEVDIEEARAEAGKNNET